MTALPTIKGKIQTEVQRETLEFAASLCRARACRSERASGGMGQIFADTQDQEARECAAAIRAQIPSVVEINHG